MKRIDFDFELPEGLIALRPQENRLTARLLKIGQGDYQHAQIADLPNFIQKGDVLVINNTKVLPARLYGVRKREGALDETGARVEVTLTKRLDAVNWRCFLRPAKRVRVGDILQFDEIRAKILSRQEGEAEICFDIPPAAMDSILTRIGQMPLPPYIESKRPTDAQDEQDYQTIFARHQGAIAAPTAGLHFTPELMAQIKAQGVQIVELTLHVGAGTFLPVKVDDIAAHKMHAEWGQISAKSAAQINAAKAAGGRVVAIGTTSLRLLESAADAEGMVHPFEGETDIFISPGYRFKIVDSLLTNFHLPQSSLFMLVCAFAGYETMRQAYKLAIDQKYRFYSYGDACFLERAPMIET